MPRLNEGRDTTAEREVARRVFYERTLRGWSLDTLARAMTDIGCVMPPTAIHKIEKGQPPRSISVTELLAFAQVFSLTPDDMLRTVEEAQHERIRELAEQERECVLRTQEHLRALLEVRQRLAAVRGLPEQPTDLAVTASDGSSYFIEIKSGQ